MCQTNQQGLLWFNISKGTGWVHNFKIWVCLKIECLKSWCFIGYIRFISLVPIFRETHFHPRHMACCNAGGMAKAGPMPMSLGSTPTWKAQGIRNTGGFMMFYELWALGVSLIMGFPKMLSKSGSTTESPTGWEWLKIWCPKKMCGSDMSSRVYLT